MLIIYIFIHDLGRTNREAKTPENKKEMQKKYLSNR